MGSFAKRLAAVVVVLLVIGWWYATRLPPSPFDGETTATEPAPVEQTEYVARLADCVACHSVPGGQPFAGGLEMGTPLGSIFSTNITPDKRHGIGNYTLADFDRAVRRGVAPDGRRLYPAMPYPSYAKLSDDDVRALYDYFLNRVEPAEVENRPPEIEWPLNMRWPLEFWNLAFYRSGAYEPDPQHDEAWNRGAYLVEGPGHCGSCHTPRGAAMQEKGMHSGDGDFLSGALLDGWYAPPLRAAGGPGVGAWSEDDIVAFLKEGRNEHAVVFGSMADAFNNSTSFMTDADLAAIAHYLKSLPAVGNASWTYDDSTTQVLEGAGAKGDPAAQLYIQKCSHCHGIDGKGRGRYLPPLAGAASLIAPEPDSAVNLVLNGALRVVADGVPDSYRMPAYRVQLRDDQIAEVLSFVRKAWGNNGAPVTAQKVGELRERTDPTSDRVILLQMR